MLCFLKYCITLKQAEMFENLCAKRCWHCICFSFVHWKEHFLWLSKSCKKYLFYFLNWKFHHIKQSYPTVNKTAPHQTNKYLKREPKSFYPLLHLTTHHKRYQNREGARKKEHQRANTSNQLPPHLHYTGNCPQTGAFLGGRRTPLQFLHWSTFNARPAASRLSFKLSPTHFGPISTHFHFSRSILRKHAEISFSLSHTHNLTASHELSPSSLG